MTGRVHNIKAFSPVKLHSGLTGKKHAICHYSCNLPINQLQVEIEKADKEINQMSYKYYGLTNNVFAIIENSIR